MAISEPLRRPIRSVCLFAGSSNTADGDFIEGAAEFGRLLAREGIRLIYGGGGEGLMGAAARAAHGAGGEVLGVIPHFLRAREAAYDEVEILAVSSMHERKLAMFEQADAFAVLPGGIGTLEEIVELLSWRRLDIHGKPIVFLDLKNYWEPLFELIDHTVAAGMTPGWVAATWSVASRVEDCLALLRPAPDEPAEPALLHYT